MHLVQPVRDPVRAFAQSALVDAFGRVRMSEALTIFDSQQEYGLHTSTTWDATANGTMAAPSQNGSVSSGGNAVGPTDANTRMTPVTASATNGHYAVLQSRQYVRYIPGKSHLVFVTGVFAPAAGCAARFVLRSSTSGSVDDSRTVSQAAWNIDPFDGTGPSGVMLDFTKTQILFISAQWLGVGRVVVGFDVDGIIYPAHQFLNANILPVPYTQTFNLPVRLEARNTGASEFRAWVGYFDAANGVFLELVKGLTGGTISFVCCSVQSEGGNLLRGFPRSVGRGAASVAVTARRPVLAIRPKATYNSRTNRGHIGLADYDIAAQTNPSYHEIVIGGTLTAGGGAPTWTSVGDASIAEYCLDADAISGGTTVISGYVLSGTGATKGAAQAEVDLRNPLILGQIDALAATQYALTIVCTSTSGTSNILAAMNWHEQIL